MNRDRQPQTAVLLAAGRGSRLRPHTDRTPKPLLPVNGRPTLDIVLNAIARAGIGRVLIITHYLEEQIHDYVGDGSPWGVEIAFTHQAEMLGTANALNCAFTQHPDWFDAPFLLSATDYLYTPDFLSNLVTFHQGHSAEITLSLKHLTDEQLFGRSSVRFAPPHSAPPAPILEVVEKPARGTAPSTYSANLTYLLPPTICPLLSTIPSSPRGEYEIQTAINQLLHNGTTAYGLQQPIPSEWQPLSS